MKSFYAAALLFLALFSCTQSKDGLSSTEGTVKGEVVWSSGNQMPSIDGPKGPASKPVQREVYFCTPQKMGELQAEGVLFKGVDALAVKMIKTDENGKYSVALKSGKYSVFTKEEGGFFANQFDGDGFINIVEVQAGKVVELNININYEAAY